MPGNAFEETEPVVRARPVRGQEIRKMGVQTLKKEGPGGEVYYEGFMDGKRYMVPDSNLEAMKDMINFTMRKRISLRYKHQTSYDLGEYDRFNDMLKSLLKKFDDLESVETSSGKKSIDTQLDRVEEPSKEMEQKKKDDGSILCHEKRPLSLNEEKEKQGKSDTVRKPSKVEDEKQHPSKEDATDKTPLALEKEKTDTVRKPSKLQDEKTPPFIRDSSDKKLVALEKDFLKRSSKKDLESSPLNLVDRKVESKDQWDIQQKPSIEAGKKRKLVESNGEKRSLSLNYEKKNPSKDETLELQKREPIDSDGEKIPSTLEVEKDTQIQKDVEKVSPKVDNEKIKLIRRDGSEQTSVIDDENKKQIESDNEKKSPLKNGKMIPSKLDGEGRSLNSEHRMMIPALEAGKPPSTLKKRKDLIRGPSKTDTKIKGDTEKISLPSMDEMENPTNARTGKRVPSKLDAETGPSSLEIERKRPIEKDEERKRLDPDSGKRPIRESVIMTPIKEDAGKDEEKPAQPNAEFLRNIPSHLKKRQRKSIKFDDDKKYLNLGDQVGTVTDTIADKRIHPDSGTRQLTGDIEKDKPIESESMKKSLSFEDARDKPFLSSHGGGNGLRRSEDREGKQEELDGALSSAVEEIEEYRVRFLISGHFHPDETPMFIIQEYDAESGIFDDQITDIKRTQIVDDVDINIAGKFYTENILERHDAKRMFLNIKPYNIEIDNQRSKIYQDCFEENFKIENLVDILLKGKFINSKNTKKITPMLSFSIMKHSFSGASSDNIKGSFIRTKPQLSITRFDETSAKKRSNSMIHGLEKAVVNIASISNISFEEISNKWSSFYLKSVNKPIVRKKSPSKFSLPEVITNNKHTTALYAYLPVISLSHQNMLTGSEMDIIEVVSENKDRQKSSQVVKRRKRKVIDKAEIENHWKMETSEKGAAKAVASVEEYICRIKDYRPTKRKIFSLF